jgi:hypothetical protein
MMKAPGWKSTINGVCVEQANVLKHFDRSWQSAEFEISVISAEQ